MHEELKINKEFLYILSSYIYIQYFFLYIKSIIWYIYMLCAVYGCIIYKIYIILYTD